MFMYSYKVKGDGTTHELEFLEDLGILVLLQCFELVFKKLDVCQHILEGVLVNRLIISM